MCISKYELATLYGYDKEPKTGHYLIRVLDDCSYGYCRCNDKEVELLHSTSAKANLESLCIEAIKKEIADVEQIDIESELYSKCITKNDNLFNYIISYKAVDSILFDFSGHTITCANFEILISDVKSKLNVLIDDIKKKVELTILASSNIIILGKAQQLFLITYYIKELLSAAPLLPDERFINEKFKDSPDDIIEIGTKLYEERKKLKHRYSLMIFDKESKSDKELISLEKGQNINLLQKIEYFGPILVKSDDLLKIQIDGIDKNIEIPYSFEPSSCDLIEVGLGIKNDEMQLNIKRCLFPERIFPVALK